MTKAANTKAGAPEQDAPEQDAPKTYTPGFIPAQLHSLGGGVWVYRHPDKAEEPPDEFWREAKSDFGMKDGDCVIFLAGKQAALIVV